MPTASEKLRVNQRHLRFMLDLVEILVRHPIWSARMVGSQFAQIRARGTARYCRRLQKIDHEKVDPRFARLEARVGGASSVHLDKATIVSRFCALLQPMRVLEIGTFRGGMTAHIARNTPDDCRIWTLDLPREKLATVVDQMIQSDIDLARMDAGRVGEEWRSRNRNGKIEQLWGDSLTFDFSSLAPFDLIYVDGSHASPWVDKDTENAFRLLSPTGAILWDDCLWRDVQRALGRFAVDRPIFLFEDDHTAGYLQIDGQPVSPQ
jgi:predicted O-methyltransferase YrrM